jgi:predicted small lipoprotein YifL
MRLRRSLSLAVALGALAGCGSASVDELPPAAEPPRSPAEARTPAGTVTAVGNGPEGVVADAATGVAALEGRRRLAVVSARERRLELYDARTLRRVGRAPAGVGPTRVACLDRGPCYVADTRGGALLVYAVGAGIEPTRRYALPGGPYGIALDRARRRLFVTLPARNELVELVAHGRPHVVRRWPTVRQPDSVAVDQRTGDVLVTGRVDGVLERVTP